MLAPRKRAQPEDRERHQGVALAQFDDHERDQEEHSGDQAGDRPRRSPADVDRVDHGVDQQRQARRNGHRTGDVKGASGLLATALDQRSRGQRRGDQSDRDVDEQHPAPAQPTGEDAAEKHAGGAAGAGDRAPDTQRAVTLRAVGERRGDDRQGGRRHDRCAQPLDGAGGDQPGLGLREATAQRRQGEHHEAEHEHPATPQQVGHSPAEQQEAAEGQRVGVHHPGEVVAGEVQVSADGWQRDVDDRCVDHDHELSHREQQQCEILRPRRGERGDSGGTGR